MQRFDAIIFDMDGVITKTSKVHSTAWKKMFDEYLYYRSKKYNEPFTEFSHSTDYLAYVDGRPRYEGVETFLKSRNITLPFGDPDDDTSKESICGLGNRKNDILNQILEIDGVELYESTIQLIHQAKREGIKVGVATSSKNCSLILAKANIESLFETKVDGLLAVELKLKGKPEPDIFIQACDNLKVEYNRAIIVEDAVSGVMAGSKGGFALVLGVAREDNKVELINNGADYVVEDLAEINIDLLNQLIQKKNQNNNHKK